MQGQILASGQKGGPSAATVRESRPHIRVWSAATLDTLAVLGLGECEVGIASLTFSVLNRGLYVAAVDESRERVISIWDWANRKAAAAGGGSAGSDGLLARVATNVRGVLAGLAFHPFDNNLVITYGLDHLTFWSRRQDGFFDREDMGVEAKGRGSSSYRYIFIINKKISFIFLHMNINFQAKLFV